MRIGDWEHVTDYPLTALAFLYGTGRVLDRPITLEQAVYLPGNEHQGMWASPLLETVFGPEPKHRRDTAPGTAAGLSLRGDLELAVCVVGGFRAALRGATPAMALREAADIPLKLNRASPATRKVGRLTSSTTGRSPPRRRSRRKATSGGTGTIWPDLPRTPACHGFTIIAKIKPGTRSDPRYGKKIEETIRNADALALLKLHYLRWVLFDIGADTYFMYQGIFDTDFDKYTEDAVALFSKYGINTVFENLEGFPEDWKSNPAAFVKFVREHQCPSFLEYGEYPYVSADEIKKALRLKAAFSTMLDQMQ